jgi:hypothetical protein
MVYLREYSTRSGKFLSEVAVTGGLAEKLSAISAKPTRTIANPFTVFPIGTTLAGASIKC